MDGLLRLVEHSSDRYPPRTFANAKAADLTVAFAQDFGTKGEQLTKRAAGDAYLAVPLDEPPLVAARRIWSACKRHDARVLNVAGNGIYTLAPEGWTQALLDSHIFEILSKVSQHWPLERVVSGGQTGVDQSGLTVAVALGLEAVGTLPAGFLRRGLSNRDERCPKGDVERDVLEGARALVSAFGNVVAMGAKGAGGGSWPDTAESAAPVAAAPKELSSGGYFRVFNVRGDPDTFPEDGERLVVMDRSNPVFGNRHKMRNQSNAERARVISLFQEDLDGDVVSGGPMWKEMVKMAKEVAEGGRIAARCFCKPLDCHVDRVAAKVMEMARRFEAEPGWDGREGGVSAKVSKPK